MSKFVVNPACVELVRIEDPAWKEAQSLVEINNHDTIAETTQFDKHYFKKFEAKNISAYEIPERQHVNRKYTIFFGAAAAVNAFASIDIAVTRGLINMAESLYPYITVLSAGLSIDNIKQSRALGRYLLFLKDSDPIQKTQHNYGAPKYY